MTKYGNVSELFKVPHDSAEHPDVLIAYLRYALEDVRKYSDRSTQHLEAAIKTLSEDTSLLGVMDEPDYGRRPS